MDSSVLPRVPRFSVSGGHAWKTWGSDRGGQWDVTDGTVESAISNIAAVNQRNSFDVVTDVEGFYESTFATLSTPKAHRASLGLVLRTPTLYIDADRIGVVAWPQGPGFGPTQSYQVKLTVTNAEGSSKTLSCGSSTQKSSVVCLISLNKDEWFSTTTDSVASVTAYIVGTSIVSESADIVLAATSSSADLTSYPDAWVELPEFPMVAGSTFNAELYAYATSEGGSEYALSTWIMDLYLVDDASFVDCSSSFYGISASTDGNKTRLVASMDSSVDAADVTGKVLIATLQLKLGTSFEASSSALLSTLFIDDMVSTSSNKMVNDKDAKFFSAGDFNTRGIIAVESAVDAGILSYIATSTSGTSDDAELVNLRVSDGESVSVVTKLVPSCHTTNSPTSGSSSIKCAEGSTLSTVSTDAVCTSTNSAIVNVAVDSCATEFAGTESMGGDVNVTVEYEDFTSFVTLRVWFLESVALSVSDFDLNAIASSCKDTVWQQATLSAIGNLTMDGGQSMVVNADLTPSVTFETDSEAVSIAESTVTGVSEGSATITALGASLPITVNATAVMATELHSIAINDIVALNDPSFGSFSTSYDLDVKAKAVHSLTQESDVASIFTYVLFSDGASQYVQDGVTGVALKPTILEVSSNATSKAPMEVVVPVGAGSYAGSDMLDLAWVLCDDTLTTGQVYVDVDLPAVVAVDVSIDNSEIYSAADSIAVSGLNVDQSAEVTVTLEFEDGSTRDFSSDSRLSLQSSHSAVEIDGNILSVADGVSSVVEDVEITASFGDYTNITASATISVDTYCGLQLSQQSYPACADCGSNKSTLYAFAGLEGGYQQLVVELSVESCLGSTYSYSLSSNVNVTIGNAEVINTVESPCTPLLDGTCVLADGELASTSLIGVSAGSSSIVVDWFGHSATTYVSVSDTALAVSAITIHSPSTALYGEVNDTSVMKLSIEFSDGSKLATVKTSSTTILFDQFLTFSSSYSDYISVSSTGTLTLHSNTPGSFAVDIEVADLTDSVSASVALFGNLYAACSSVDVDLGSPDTSPFPAVSVGDTFELPVYINTCDDVLTSFQIKVFFDSNIVVAVKDGHSTSGADWGYDIVYTYNDPVDMVQIIGSESNSDVGGTDVLLTTLTFEAVGTGASSFTAEVVDTVGVNGAILGTSGRYAIAGAGYIFVDVEWFPSSRRELASTFTTLGLLESSILKTPRQLAECTDVSCGCGLPELNGDTNGDCKFTVSDLDFLKRYIAGDILLSDLDDETYQLKQMNPDFTVDDTGSSTIDGVDINYILYGLAKMYRFLDTVEYTVSASNEVHLTVRLTDDTGTYVTDGSTTIVRAELGSLGPENISISEGTYTNQTQDGSMTLLASPTDEDGEFTLVFTTNTPLAGVAFALAIETLDSGGGGADESTRRFPFWGTTWGPYGDAQFTFVPFSTIVLTAQTTEAVSTLSTEAVSTQSTQAVSTLSTKNMPVSSTEAVSTLSTKYAPITSTEAVSTLSTKYAPITSTAAVSTLSTKDAPTTSTVAVSTLSTKAGITQTTIPVSGTTTSSTSTTSQSHGDTSQSSEAPTSVTTTGTTTVGPTTASQTTLQPVHCVGAWSEWGACSKTCGLGAMQRTFAVSTSAMNGGNGCSFADSGIDSLECNEGNCPRACAGDWSEWSTCSESCGGTGTQSRDFAVDLDASTPNCAGEDETLTVGCGAASCPDVTTTGPATTLAPIDCVGAWSEWSTCSETCGLGAVQRTFTVSTSAENGGAECNFANSGVDSLECNEGNCPRACAGDWSEWSTCSATCGGTGTQNRDFVVDLDSSTPNCVGEDQTLTVGCGAVICPIVSTTGPATTLSPVDCVGAWGAWGSCSVTCGLGSIVRTFAVTTDAANGGAACSYTDGGSESSPCDDGDCANACAGDWTEWNECSVTCGGGGTQSREFVIDTDNYVAGCEGGDANLTAACGAASCPSTGTTISTNAPSTTATTTSSTIAAIDCEGSWGSWGSCSASCGLGSVSRTFTVSTIASGGGAACAYVDLGSESIPCDEGDCVRACIGDWTEWSDCSQSCGGGGTRTRLFTVDLGISIPNCQGDDEVLSVSCGANACPPETTTEAPTTTSLLTTSTFDGFETAEQSTSGAKTTTTDPLNANIEDPNAIDDDESMMMIIIIVVVVLLLLIIIIIIIVVLKRRRKSKRVAVIVPTDDSKTPSKKRGEGSTLEMEMSPMVNSKGGQGAHHSAVERIDTINSPTAISISADGTAGAIGGGFAQIGNELSDEEEAAAGSGKVNSRERRRRRARRKMKPEASAAPKTFIAGGASYDHLDTQQLKGTLMLEGVDAKAFQSDPTIRASIIDALSWIPQQAGLNPGQIQASVKKPKLVGNGEQLEVPFVMKLKVPSPRIATALCDDFNEQISNLSPGFTNAMKASLDQNGSSAAKESLKLVAATAHVNGIGAEASKQRLGFKVGCNFSLTGISLEEFEADLIIKKSFQSSVDDTLKGLGRNLTMGTPVSVVKIAERKGKVIIRCQGVVEGVQEDVQALAEKFNATKDLGHILIPRWQENSLAAGIGTLQKKQGLKLGKYAMRVSKKITAASTDKAKHVQSRKGELTLSGFKGFDTKDIPEMQTLLQKSLSRLKQFRDTDDAEREVLVTGFEKIGDSLSVKYRTRVKRLSRKSVKMEAAIPLDEEEFLDSFQSQSSQTFAKKFNMESIAIKKQSIIEPSKAPEQIAQADNSELSNVTGFVALDGVSKARLNRSPKILNAMKRVILRHANCKELELPGDAITVTSIRTQVDKSVKVNYKIDLQGGTGTAADAAVKRLARNINPTQGNFLEDVEKEAAALGEQKMQTLKKMKLKKSNSERVSAAGKRKVKTAAEMVEATRRMLSVAKQDPAPETLGEDGVVESRRARRRRSSRKLDTATRETAMDLAKDEEEAEIMARRQRRKQRGERRRSEGKTAATADGDTVAKVSSRRERRRGKSAEGGDKPDDRKSRREQRRAKRAEAKGEEAAATPGSRAARRAERRAKKKGEAKSASPQNAESPAGIAQQTRSHWSSIRAAAADAQDKRRALRLQTLAPVSSSAAAGGEGKKKKGKLLRTVTGKKFDDATDALLAKVRETKAERAAKQTKRKSGIGGVGRSRTRTESKADEIRARADMLMKEELGI